MMDCFADNRFSPREPGLFQWIFDSVLVHGDRYFHLADFQSYCDAQSRAETDYAHPETWAHKAILNVARVGRFSSDRTVREYARDVWGIEENL